MYNSIFNFLKYSVRVEFDTQMFSSFNILPSLTFPVTTVYSSAS